jgi:hypothetical protein
VNGSNNLTLFCLSIKFTVPELLAFIIAGPSSVKIVLSDLPEYVEFS